MPSQPPGTPPASIDDLLVDPQQALADRRDAPYRLIFHRAGIGMVRLSLSGTILEVNQRFADIVGRQPRDLIGLHPEDITHPQDIVPSRAHVENVLGGAQEGFQTEKRYVRPDGQAVWAAVNVVLLRDEHGQPRELVAVIEDITERQRMQEAMSSARAAERASKAKTEFLSRMSHELRTPLNAMLGFAQLLRVDPRHPLHDDQRTKVAHIERAGAHLLAMLTDVLDLSRIEAGSLPMSIEPLAVGDVIEAALAMTSNQATDASVQLLATPPETGLRVRADQLRLRQVLVNLLSNAIKYNRRSGQVLVEAMGVGDEVVISVSDTGRGMDAQQLAHLFEPFNRLGAERTPIEGTGIGLVIVKRLVELMQGRIEVSSQPDAGTRFRIWLPRAERQTEAEDSDFGQRIRTNFGSLDTGVDATLTLLYAEDNAINVELLRQVMRMRPQWHLEVARDGHTAIAMARAEPPDLLLLDMHLGDMSGLDVSDALMMDTHTALIPRVALSADVMPDQIAEARQRGFVEYLTKPLDVSRLLNLLDGCARGELP
ncbi:hybrid sensor histidine kinase/response regulator [Aquabacterium parvum]|uniref:hybrid sensor histidine kinase/response regulator n=1 Tax=Aquabacterium parvum TaxID=70584 RepID=UPI000718C8B9|nr:PAS domain-containing hybrid sensor histidine kinase/response regulator [Aquabacterium parvum]